MDELNNSVDAGYMESDSTVQIVGFIAGALTTTAFVPQVVQSWRNGGRGLSWKMLLMFGSGVGLWFVYGAMMASLPIMVANGLTAVQIMALVYLKKRGAPPSERLSQSGEIVCDAVLFDMDGTLVDSTASVEVAWGEWADRHGIPFDKLLPILHGRRAEDTMRLLCPHIEDLQGELRWLLQREEEILDGVQPIPGAAELVASLPTGRWAVVTSAVRSLALVRLRAAGLPVPKVLITADDVERGKPDPEGYLTAAKRLGVRASECLVLEDAPAGIQAGLAGGMQVLGLSTTHAAEQLGDVPVLRDLSTVERTGNSLPLRLRFVTPDQPVEEEAVETHA